MTEFIVELHLPKARASEIEQGPCRARTAAEQLTAEGLRVHYLRSFYVPDDDTCFHLFRASTVDEVGRAAGRAERAFERMGEAVVRQCA